MVSDDQKLVGLKVPFSDIVVGTSNQKCPRVDLPAKSKNRDVNFLASHRLALGALLDIRVGVVVTLIIVLNLIRAQSAVPEASCEHRCLVLVDVLPGVRGKLEHTHGVLGG